MWSVLSYAFLAAAGLAAVGYSGLVAMNRARYGRAARPAPENDEELLDRFIPAPEILERHHLRMAAPADVVLATAKDMRLLDSPLVKAVIKLREIAVGTGPDVVPRPKELLPQMLSMGWVVLAERAGREIVLGAVTRPWEADVSFRSVPSGDFAAFREPGYVKIAWTLRADPVGERSSIFRTETRASTTDPQAGERFRRYWSFVAPGVALIRLAMLGPLKAAAEKRAAVNSP